MFLLHLQMEFPYLVIDCLWIFFFWYVHIIVAALLNALIVCVCFLLDLLEFS